MAIRRPERARGPLSAQLRAALYYARKRRLGRLSAPSGGGPVSSTLWRMNIIEGFSPNYIWLRKVQYREEIGGVNVSTDPTTGTASASSQAASYPPSLAFPGSGNGWSTAQSPTFPVTLDFTFNEAKIIKQVFFEVSPSVANYGIKSFEIQAFVSGSFVTVSSKLDLITGDYSGVTYTHNIQE